METSDIMWYPARLGVLLQSGLSGAHEEKELGNGKQRW